MVCTWLFVQGVQLPLNFLYRGALLLSGKFVRNLLSRPVASLFLSCGLKLRHYYMGKPEYFLIRTAAVACQHHVHVLCRANQFAYYRYGLWSKTVKAVNPDMAFFQELRLRNPAFIQVDIVLCIGEFSVDCLFIGRKNPLQVRKLARQNSISTMEPITVTRQLFQILRRHVILLHLRDEVVYHFDERVFSLHTAKNLQLSAHLTQNT